MSKDHTGFPGGMFDLESLRPRDGAETTSPDDRIEELRKGLFEARDAMLVMSNWVAKSDPAGHSWALRMVDRASATLSGSSAATVAEASDNGKLFCDLQTDEEKSNFFLSGRAYETGVIARSIQNDVAMAYHRCAEYAIAAQQQAEPGADEAVTHRMNVARTVYAIHAQKQEPQPEHRDWFNAGFKAGFADRAAQSGQRAGVAEGWQLVPKEPTKAMLDAAERVDWSNDDVRGNCCNQWNAMLAAAPTQQQGGE